MLFEGLMNVWQVQSLGSKEKSDKAWGSGQIQNCISYFKSLHIVCTKQEGATEKFF